MRMMLRVMLSSASLAAFSASVMKAGFGPVQGPLAARPLAGAQPDATPQPPVLRLAPNQSGPLPPAQAPRGSLLDISI
jgi:hypothetical protein